MTKRVIPKRQSGFTLLEIMVVMLLIGVTMAIASIRINRDGNSDAKNEADRFVALLNHVREESLLTGRLHGIEVEESEKQYRFLVEAGGWQPVENDRILRPRTLPDQLEIRSDLEFKPKKKKGEKRSSVSINKKLKKKKKKNIMLITPVGDITPFEIVISGSSMDYRIALDKNSEPVVIEKDPDKF